jgi:hypothetical protein
LIGFCGGNTASVDNKESSEKIEDATSKTDQEPEASERTLKQQVLAEDLQTIPQIEDWIADIALLLNQKEFPVSDPLMLEIDGKQVEVIVVNAGGPLEIVRGGSPTWNTRQEGFRYITRFNELVLLESLRKNENEFTAYKFYYGDQKLLGAKTATASTAEGLRQAIPQDFEVGEDDFRGDFAKATQKHQELMEKIKMNMR